MKATDYKTYKDYCDARRTENFQVLPSSLWKALKEENSSLVEPKRSNPAYT